MVTVAPFRGLRFAPDLDPAACTAPPYDAIDEGTARRLRRLSPYNIVRLERPRREPGGPADRYRAAGRTYRSWLADGVLRGDPRPTMTVYEQVFAHRGDQRRQRGILCALGLEPWGVDVLPHERVFRPPIEDRKRLLRSVPANVSPVFVVHDAPAPQVEQVLAARTADAPAAEFTDEDGVQHRVWVAGDPALHRRVARSLAPRSVLMADGHHRYTTALEYREEVGDAPGSGYVLAYLVPAAADGPVVRPMHRLVRGLPADTPARLQAAGLRLTRLGGAAVGAVVREVGQHPGLCFGLVTAEGAALVTASDHQAVRERLVAAAHRALARVDVAVLHALLASVLEVPDERISATHDHRQACDVVSRGAADGLFLVRAPTTAQIRAVARAGARLPPKSTSFHPKPRTGLVLRPLEEA